MKWNKVVDTAPPEGRDLLIWNGRYMFVSDSHFFSEEEKAILKGAYSTGRVISPGGKPLQWNDCLGYFQEFGHKTYFDDPKVYWAELPAPPSDIIQGVQEVSKS